MKFNSAEALRDDVFFEENKEERLRLAIKTKFYGMVEIDEDQIFNFPCGIYGFEEYTKFVFIKSDDLENSFICAMQSFNEPDLSFIVIKISEVIPEYVLSVSQDVLEDIKLERSEDAEVYGILTVPSGNPKDMTVNLQGPIIINPVAKTGRQAISLNEKYSTRHKISDELEKNNKQTKE